MIEGRRVGLRGRLIEFVVKYNLMPARIRWRKCASGVGRLFNDVFHMLNEDERGELAQLMYDWGISDADEIVEALGTERSLHGCAIAVMAMNRIFGIESHVAKENEEEVIIHATRCLWKDRAGWTPEVCTAIERYDIGLVKGINGNVEYLCTKRRSRGNEVCEVILTITIERG